MTWWLWTLVTVGAFYVAGFVALGSALLFGRPVDRAGSWGEFFTIVFLWPAWVTVLIGIFTSQRQAQKRASYYCVRAEGRE